TQFKEKHPNKKFVSVVGKAGGGKWKSLSDVEKAPYVAKEDKRNVEYIKTMDAYNKKLVSLVYRNLTFPVISVLIRK
ncbi:hypothetical protein MKX03_030792, partial [Papaver bracteatum]